VRRLLPILVLAALLGCAKDPAPAQPDYPLIEGLGDHRVPVTTRSSLAQRYFDQGMLLVYGFNHEAAVASFEAAARLDPDCAMCPWGVALALGPNINAPMGPEANLRALAAVREAQARSAGASDREREHIAALAQRYSAAPGAERAELDRAYADAMLALQQRHPDDLDTATLAAEAQLDLTPWDYWIDPQTPRPNAVTALALLERVLERDPRHPGANHYYIHAVEEYQPERAVPSAERLAGIAPGAGHLVHMPSHIFWRVGRYDEALEINRLASAADEAYLGWCRRTPFYRALYYPHNVHFLWAAAMAEGRADLALTTSRRLVAAVPDAMLAEYRSAEEWRAIPLFTLLRFGRFDSVLAEPRPAPERRYLTGIWHYARGLAQLRAGALDQARAERAALASVEAEPGVAQLDFVGVPAAEYLRLAGLILDGELAAAAGETDRALAALEAAVALDSGFPYIEPPRWYFPPRQALGAVLLQAGRAREAEAVYRADLAAYPRNGWSLFGLAQSLAAQGRAAEADAARTGFEHAWARADVELGASRM
jgi:tetratricopeptide (TPR) repeat protein